MGVVERKDSGVVASEKDKLSFDPLHDARLKERLEAVMGGVGALRR